MDDPSRQDAAGFGSDAPPGAISYRVLGRLAAVRGPGDAAEEIDLGAPKQRATLALLLLERGRVVSTDRLVQAIWAEDAPPSAVAGLQAYISNLRRLLRDAQDGPPPILLRAPGYVLEAGPGQLDLAAFSDAARATGLALGEERWEDALEAADRALGSYGGPLLEDLAHEHWVRAEADRVAELLAEVREARAAALLAQDAVAEAIRQAQELRAAQPLRDRGCWLHMVALHRAGRSPEALEQFVEHSRRLDEGLGLAPGPELRELQVAILRQDPALATWPRPPARSDTQPDRRAATTIEPVSGTSAPVRRAPTPELLEREAETAVIRDRLLAARSGSGGVLLLEGSPGAGKSALLRDARRASAELGLRPLQAVGGELEREFAFGVVRQLFEPAVLALAPERRERLLSGAAALAGSVVGAAPPVSEPGPDASFATLHGLYWLVAALTDEQPLMLLLDDAHWADAPSLRFLDFLSRRVEELPVLVMIALRPREPGAEQELLAALADSPVAQVLRPGALSPSAVRTLVDGGLGEGSADDVVSAAYDATKGNPLLLRELVRTLAADGGTPTAEAVRAALPSSVTRSVARRLDALPAEQREVARGLAVLGDRTPAWLLAEATGVAEPAVRGALEAMRAAELVEDDPLRFVHPLIGQAIADAAGAREHRRLHSEAVEALRRRPGTEEDVVVHLLAAPPLGEPWVVPFLRAAAARAMDEGAADAAVRRLRRAFDELHATGQTADDALLLELALAEVYAGDPASEGHLLGASRSQSPVVAAEALRVAFGVGWMDDPDSLRGLVVRAPQLDAELLAPEHARLRAELGAQLLSALTLFPVLRAERAAALARAGVDAPPGVLAMLAFESALTDARRDQTAELVQRALYDGGRGAGGRLYVELPAVASWAITAAVAVEAPELLTAAMADAEAAAARRGSRLASAFMTYMRAIDRLHFGSIVEAEALAREALGTMTGFGSETLQTSVNVVLVSALVALGRLAEADALIASLPDDEHFADRLDAGTIYTARAELRLARDRPADAVADLRLLASLTARYGWQRFPLGYGVADLARALALSGEREEARSIAEAEAARSRGRGVAGHEAMGLTALGLASEGPAALDALRAAVDAAGRSPVPRVQALARLELGAALRRANRRVDARAHLAVARDLAHRIGATTLFDRATQELTIAGGRPQRIALAGVDALTPGERRTAEHAARGLTNRQIAEVLFVTRKTVEFQLGAAYGKLGIRSRAELPAALGAVD